MRQILQRLFILCVLCMAISFIVSLLCYTNGEPNAAMIAAYVCLGFVILVVICSAYRLFKK